MSHTLDSINWTNSFFHATRRALKVWNKNTCWLIDAYNNIFMTINLCHDSFFLLDFDQKSCFTCGVNISMTNYEICIYIIIFFKIKFHRTLYHKFYNKLSSADFVLFLIATNINFISVPTDRDFYHYTRKYHIC